MRVTKNNFCSTHDSAGNIVSANSVAGKIEYGYDPIYQLTSEKYLGPKGTVAYEYDDAGNRTKQIDVSSTKVSNYDASNELVSSTGLTFTYDLAGNLASKSNPASGFSYQ